MIKLAMKNRVMTAINHNAFVNPRVKVRVGDAYQYIRRSIKIYDAIFIDFPDVTDYDLAKLYSTEFYAMIRKRVRDDGFIVFDAVNVGAWSKPDAQGKRHVMPKNDWYIYFHTLRKAGFKTIVPYVSHLGFDNAVAKDFLRRAVKVPPEPQWQRSRYARMFPNRKVYLRELDQQIKIYLDRYVMARETGFIFLTPKMRKLKYEYKNYGIQMNVMDTHRFRNAFIFPFDYPKVPDQKKVNSIMRPVLPTIPYFYIRTP